MRTNELIFAVTDVETTGLHPEWNDRIVEIAIVRVDSAGKILDEYATLVNPSRDLGPIEIHGVTASMAKHAPPFLEVAGDIASRLADALFVGHNALFDLRFLRAEYRRAGYPMPDIPYVCTMLLAPRTYPTMPGRSLEKVCSHLHIRRAPDHTAHGDALATADVLGKCIWKLVQSGCALAEHLGMRGGMEASVSWETPPPSGKICTRSTAQHVIEEQRSLISRLVQRLPSARDVTTEVGEYLGILDRVLEDRSVTADEAELLISYAEELGLVQEQVLAAHRRYVRDLLLTAVSDGVLSELEREDAERVRSLLGISEEDYSRIRLELLRDYQPRTEASAHTSEPDDITGKRVCFTGIMTSTIDGVPISRELAERFASERGMVVEKNVTKRLDYLVVSDPESISTKARKARQYGIRILAEPVFWMFLKVTTD
jgi:DNA polymerase-3 subunit epsilon